MITKSNLQNTVDIIDLMDKLFDLFNFCVLIYDNMM